MKKIYLFILASVMMLLSACHDKLWDAIDDLDARVAKLEELCKEMNTNISSLQTIVSALQEKDFITNILPIEKDGKEIGYTIVFDKHDPITLYMGEDGKDAGGSTSQMPIIGVAKDSDEVYYWTLNGEWLLDENGNKIRVTGTNGKDGVTPQLKIENGYWYISYDNGATWTELGKAVGENGQDGEDGKDGQDGQPGADGQPGKDGVDGDSMFSNVTFDENNVYFTLANGTVLVVPRGSESIEIDPSENIKFEDLNVKYALLQMNIDTNGDGEISYNEAATYKGQIQMTNNTNILSFKEFQYFTGITTIEKSAFSGCSNLFEIILSENIKVISNSAFYNCSKVTIVNFPSALLSIGNSAFYNCDNLKTIIIPQTCKTIGESAFEDCSKLAEVSIKGCETISDFAFKNCNSLISLEINEGCTYIGKSAFLDHALVNVDNLPSTIEYFGPNAFSSSSLASFTFPDSLKSGYLPYDKC